MPKERIAKVIARYGVASRRKAEVLIEEGAVKINGRTLKECSTKVDMQKDKISVHGKVLKQENDVILALNKPRGYLTTKSDTHRRKTVYDLLPKKYQSLHPVGRLDKETSGLLLFTNNGDLTYKITHPKFEIRKKYQVSIKGKLKEEDIQRLKKGFKIPGVVGAGPRAGPQCNERPQGAARTMQISPCNVENLLFDKKENKTRFILDIGEGKKREIRKIFEFLGYELLRLHRVQIGGLSLRGIKMGRIRALDEKDIKKILSPS